MYAKSKSFGFFSSEPVLVSFLEKGVRFWSKSLSKTDKTHTKCLITFLDNFGSFLGDLGLIFRSARNFFLCFGPSPPHQVEPPSLPTKAAPRPLQTTFRFPLGLQSSSFSRKLHRPLLHVISNHFLGAGGGPTLRAQSARPLAGRVG